MLKKILPGTRGGSASVSHPRYICRALQRGDTVELTCASLAAGGDGVCKTDDGLVVFVPRALPGERLVARMVNVKRKYASGELLRTVTPSADAVSPPCKYFSRCGGCTWQSLSYDAQLFAKESSVKEALRRIGRVTRQDVDSVVDPIRPAPRQLAYRNKVTFAAAAGAAGAGGEAATTATASRPASRRRRNARAKHEEAHVADRALAPGMSHPGLSMTLGLRDRSSPSLVVPVSECLLQPAPANAVLQALQSAIASVSPRHLRRAVLRSGLLPNSSEERVVVDLQVARECRRELLPIAEGLLREHAGIVSGVTMSVCPGGDPSAVPEGDAEVLAGCGDLEVLAGGVRLRVSPRSFTQTNPEQAETLYALVRQAAGLTGKETVLDLYCGTGTFALVLAGSAARVVGFEAVPSAVVDARRNAEACGMGHVEFVCGDLETNGEELLQACPDPDVVVADPARAGLSKAVREYLKVCGARRIIYVSCNPSTQARDILDLCGHGLEHQRARMEDEDAASGAESAPYVLARVTPVDMFPQTYHVETVAVLEKV